jgi:uncharacterized repeat protein (TIGR01451 family)
VTFWFKDSQPDPEPEYDVSIVKTVSLATVNIGDTVTYTFTVTNTGDSPLTEVEVTDPMFAEAEGWPKTVNTLAVGETATFTQTYTIPEGTEFPLINTATVVTKEEVTDNDSATVTEKPIIPPIDDNEEDDDNNDNDNDNDYNDNGGNDNGGNDDDDIIIIPDDPTPEGPAIPLEPQYPEEDETNTNIIIDEEEIPFGTALPKTGEVAPILFYGLGTFIAAMGARLRRK